MNYRIQIFGKLLIISMITCFIGSCNHQTTIMDDNYFGSKVMILGHRGMGVSYYKPGNTFESIQPVIGIGADGSEMDIQMTHDSVLVIYHDNELNPVTTCSGRISQQDWSQIKECKYYAVQNMIFVQSVDELFSKIPLLTNYYFSFDCKIDYLVDDVEAYKLTYLRAIKRICEKFDMSTHVLLEGDDDLLHKAQLLGLNNPLFINTGLDQATISTAFLRQYKGISTSIDELDLVNEAHQKGLYVMAWSPDNFTENKTTLKKKADIIQSDDPISILKYLERYNYEFVIP